MKRFLPFLPLLYASILWSQQAFVYHDRIVIEKPLDRVTQIMVPARALEVNLEPKVTIVAERFTNLYPSGVMPRVKEYLALTNTLAEKQRTLQEEEKKLASLNEKLSLYRDILRNLASNPSARTADLMEKYEKQLFSTEETSRQIQKTITTLQQEIANLNTTIQEISTFLASRAIPMRIWDCATVYQGTLTYSLPGGWRIRYTLDTDHESLGADVAITSPQAFEEMVSSLWIIGFPYTSQTMPETLPRLKLYLQSLVSRRSLSAMPKAAPSRAAEAMAADAMAEPEAPPIETTEAQGSVWQITNRLLLSHQSTVTLWEARKIGMTSSYFVIVPKSSWGWYAITLSNTLPYTLIPGEVVLQSKNHSRRVRLDRPVLPQTTYQFPGIEVRDIEVKRELVRDYKDMPGLLRPTILHEKSWKITIKNRLNKTLSLTAWERIPLPAEERIVIKNLTATDKTPGELRSLQTNDGIIRWGITLRPGEEKTLSLGYTIEYPRDTDYYEQEEEYGTSRLP